jgi:hypothetical protein
VERDLGAVLADIFSLPYCRDLCRAQHRCSIERAQMAKSLDQYIEPSYLVLRQRAVLEEETDLGLLVTLVGAENDSDCIGIIQIAARFRTKKLQYTQAHKRTSAQAHLIIKSDIDISIQLLPIHVHSHNTNTHAHTHSQSRSIHHSLKTRNRPDVLLLRPTASHTLNIAQQPTLPSTRTPVQRRGSTLKPKSSRRP